MNSLDCSVKEEVDVGHFRVVEGHSLFFFVCEYDDDICSGL